jgi:hypothetical protein
MRRFKGKTSFGPVSSSERRNGRVKVVETPSADTSWLDWLWRIRVRPGAQRTRGCFALSPCR